MAVAIKRVIQFSHAKMNSVQSEQTRIRAKNKYKNDHICEEFKKVKPPRLIEDGASV